MWDSVWEDIFRNREWGKYPSEDIIRFVARHFYAVERHEDIRILEVGCGPGANLWFLAREGFRFAGIDGSVTAIDKAGQLLDAEWSGWRSHSELAIGDICHLPFASSTFDAVIDNEAVYANSFEESRKIYIEIARVLRKGGVLYSKTFAEGCWGDNTGEARGRNMWMCAEGPLAGKGASRFTKLDEIPELIHPLCLNSVELHSRTCNNRRQEMREWLIVGTKV